MDNPIYVALSREMILRRQMDIVANNIANVDTAGFKVENLIVKCDPQPMPDPNGGLVECHGTGMGFNLWRLQMFRDERLRRPWFVTQTKDGVSTQDLYFWSNARMYGYRCAVDCSVKVGHYDLRGDFGSPDTMY